MRSERPSSAIRRKLPVCRRLKHGESVREGRAAWTRAAWLGLINHDERVQGGWTYCQCWLRALCVNTLLVLAVGVSADSWPSLRACTHYHLYCTPTNREWVEGMESGVGRGGGWGWGGWGVPLKHMTGQGESLQSSLKIMIIIMVISTAHYPLPNLRQWWN